MTQTSDLQALVLAIGRLEGRMGEAIHTGNNTAQKVDALSDKVAANTNLPASVAALESRVTVLEASENKRVGAMGLGGWLLRFLPLGALSAAIGAAVTFLSGRHP